MHDAHEGGGKRHHPKFADKTPRRGTSFWMHNPDELFAAIGLEPGQRFLDIGCGPGEYSLHAAGIVGETGAVLALDQNETLIEALSNTAASRNLHNLTALAADITQPLPAKTADFDVCLLSTVLHIPPVTARAAELAAEIKRVLRPGGRLAVIECPKHDLSFGPPAHMRLGPDEVQDIFTPLGFTPRDEVDLGFNYMVLFDAAS